MKSFRIVLAIALLSAVGLTASSIGSMGTAEAKAHVTKGTPGKCGVMKYYSKKDKGCVSKA